MQATVEEIMVRDVFEIDVSKTLKEAIKIFKKNNIRHLPVVSDGELIGILSRTDVMRLSFGDIYFTNEKEVDLTLLESLTISDVMAHHPKVISPADSINKVARIFIEEDFHALPVSLNDELVGIITTTDIIKYQLQKLQQQKTTTVPEKSSEKRQWGSLEQYCKNTPCSVKVLTIKPHQTIGLQYHREIDKFWKVLDGEGVVRIDEKSILAKKGDEFIIPKNDKHSIKSEKETLQILEVCYGESDKKDIVRIIEEKAVKGNSILT